MIIYKDVISGDELFTDSYSKNMKETDEGIFIEIEGKQVTEKTDVDDSMFGGNKSAEDPQEDDCAAAGVTGCNIVIQNRLMEQVGVDKKGYKKYIKLYIAALVKRVEKERPAELASFKAKVSKAVARILESFDDWQFFHGEQDFDFDNKEQAEGMLAIMGYRDEHGKMPYMLFFKDGLEEEKA